MSDTCNYDPTGYLDLCEAAANAHGEHSPQHQTAVLAMIRAYREAHNIDALRPDERPVYILEDGNDE